MGGFLAGPGGGAAIGSIFGPVGTIAGGALGILGSIFGGGNHYEQNREYWEELLRKNRPDLFEEPPEVPVETPEAPATPEAPVGSGFVEQPTEPLPPPDFGLSPLEIPILPWMLGGLNFPSYGENPTFSMDVYGQPITEQASSTQVEQTEQPQPPELSPLPLPIIPWWMYPTFPGYPDPNVHEASAGTPTFPMDVWGMPPIVGPPEVTGNPPIYQPPPPVQGQPPIITEPPPVLTPPQGPPITPPVFPGPPVTPPPAAVPKPPGLGDIGALLGAMNQGGPSVNIGGLSAPVVGGGVTNSLFPLPGINRFDIPSLGAYLLGRV